VVVKAKGRQAKARPVPKASGPVSPYLETFGEVRGRGRPAGQGDLLDGQYGDVPLATRRAKARAVAVLKVRYRSELKEIAEQEMAYIMANEGNAIRKEAARVRTAKARKKAEKALAALEAAEAELETDEEDSEDD